MAGKTVLFSLLVVLMACQLSLCIECNGKTVDDCERGHIVNDCPEYRHIMNCYLQLDRCEDDFLQMFVESYIQMYNRSINNCPGLPDGTCFFNRVHECENGIPYEVKYKSNLSAEDKQKACDEFKGKSAGRLSCFEDIRPACSPNSPQQKAINRNIQTVKDINVACGF